MKSTDPFLDRLVFCPNCHYGLEKTFLYAMKLDLHCADCGMCRASTFYSVGSDFHSNKWRQYQTWPSWPAKRPPPPYPKKDIL